jgi:hypothetical protein
MTEEYDVNADRAIDWETICVLGTFVAAGAALFAVWGLVIEAPSKIDAIATASVWAAGVVMQIIGGIKLLISQKVSDQEKEYAN